jgi:hypothetical protein
MTASYSTPRLEGRALEHALAGDGGFTVRMKDARGEFHPVGGPVAKRIRQEMAMRVAQLLLELKEQGLRFVLGDADLPVQLEEGTRSVDLRLWDTHHQAHALIEVKWTRRSLDVAQAWGWKSVPWLLEACCGGVWQRGRKPVRAGCVGVLVVRPNDWRCTVIPSKGQQRKSVYPMAAEPVRRRSGQSQAGNLKRKNNSHLRSLDKGWRKNAGKKMTRQHEKTYGGTDAGKASRRKTNKNHYEKRKSKRVL